MAWLMRECCSRAGTGWSSRSQQAGPAKRGGLAADLTAADPAARPAGAAQVVTRCGELMALPLRPAEPRQASSPDSALLLDPPAQQSQQPARIA
jgi:hypothetical protein